jgi:GNAT superfamily N-acetyltransferase
MNLKRKLEENLDSECSVKIIDAHTEKERQAIYRFRYQIQIEEMKRHIPNADHKRKRIFDQLDPWSCLAYAEANGRIVGTVRAVIGRPDEFPGELAEVFQLNCYREFAPSKRNICFATKLMVDPQFRKTPLSYRLMSKAYEFARMHNAQFSFSGSNPYLIPMYEQLGYRQIAPGFQDPGYGFIVPTLLLTEDIDYLKSVHSPYLRIARKLPNSPAAKQWLHDNIPGIFKYPVGLLTSEQAKKDYIENLIGYSPTKLSIFHNLSEAENLQLFHISTIVECESKHEYIRKGDICNELNVLIAGEMIIIDNLGGVYKATPGDILGDAGHMEQTHHQVDAVATDHSVILVLSRFQIEKLLRSQPGLSNKLNLELKNKEGR